MVPFRRLSQKGRRTLDQDHIQNPLDCKGGRERERDQYIMTFPIHPLPSMQAPFEESMLDATGQTGFVPFTNPTKNIEARQQLLCRDFDTPEQTWNFTYNCHWRNNPKGKFHPLAKTVTQIVFGVHLLHQHLEKSVADVADILLKHVNELDSFLQRANEDIEASMKDMLFRRKCLKVPMEHVKEFDRLLDDRMYRAQLLDGNITIERTINRMSAMLNDYLIDMSTFRDANQDLDMYLHNLGNAWTDANDDVGRIYSAMCGNTGGWAQFLQSLVAKAEKLGVVLVQVSSYCNEIEKRCGAASRRSLIASRSSSRNSSHSREATRAFRNFADNKPLPKVPNERPPFMPSPSPTNEAVPDAGTPPRHASNSNRRPPSIGEMRAVKSEESLKQQQQQQQQQQRKERARAQSPLSTSVQTRSDVLVPQLVVSPQMEYYQHAPRDDLDHTTSLGPGHAPRDDLDHTSLRPGHAPQGDTNETRGHSTTNSRGTKEDHSPPLTGKDSAYSSVSSGSFASPTSVQPRSASAQSAHPRAQFGLFPSSAPSTPMHSTSGRYGAMSPALVSPRPQDYPVYQRSQSALDIHTPPSSRRLLKKSSLSSLKRLFSKRKPGSVDTIKE
ncbi:hypothetical protein K504DRAFT_390870 [Pleomassaria siparia CBS 279.74]|uniref:Uncharacterized protein n=1 Tax=Pleomassaria siparia CBS 279.74 TaxID=1314801 RepID=A0A6G1JVJ6_9PLEO|nr:hypothetical protein K504DRAFT_390870 [Pleomassaria siparia CBS 279.74]